MGPMYPIGTKVNVLDSGYRGIVVGYGTVTNEYDWTKSGKDETRGCYLIQLGKGIPEWIEGRHMSVSVIVCHWDSIEES
jgi:hypothetical protein